MEDPGIARAQPDLPSGDESVQAWRLRPLRCGVVAADSVRADTDCKVLVSKQRSKNVRFRLRYFPDSHRRILGVRGNRGVVDVIWLT